VKDYLLILEKTSPEKSFGFLHFFDVHSDSAFSQNPEDGPYLPYLSDEELIAEFAGPVPEGFTGCTVKRPGRCASKYLNDLSANVEPLPEAHREFIVGLYDAGIRKLDSALEDLFTELEARGLLDEMLVVITSDHGEAFLEHGLMLHQGHHDEVARVPLLVLTPPRLGASPRRIQAMTQSTDLPPTILDLCGLQPLGQTQSLAPAIMLGTEPDPATVLFQTAVILDRDEQSEFKYIHGGARGGVSFFDRNADPEERTNLLKEEGFREASAERLSRIGAKATALLAECRALNQTLRSDGDGKAGRLSAERRRELEALGYFGDTEDDEATD